MVTVGIFKLLQQSQSTIMQKKQEQKSTPCTSYFHLVQKIGSNGKYQRTLVILFIWALYSGGVGQLGPTFFFIMQPYSCQKEGLLTQTCTKLICSLPVEETQQYVDKGFTSYTIPVQFGYYECQGAETVVFIYGAIYFGFILSVLLRALIVDSFGRKPLMIFFNGLIALGSVISISSINIWITGIGFFLVNCGVDGAMKMSFNYLTQYYDPILRQKYSIMTQIFYTVGYLLVCIASYLIPDWKITAAIFIVIPAIAGFAFCIFYLKETPRYLHLQGQDVMIRQLNKIAVINGGQLITEQDIICINEQKNKMGEQTKKKVNPSILCKYGSIRKISICYFIILFIILTLYYGSSILVDDFNLSPYLVGTILAIADFTVYFPAYKLIGKLKRKSTSLILSLLIAAASMGLIFVSSQTQDCSFCFIVILEVFLLLIFRFSTNFLYALVLIYSNELFPQRVRAASSILQLFGGFSLVINPGLLSLLQKHDINPMIYFTLSAAICFSVYGFLPQTHGQIKEEIEQVQQQQRQRQETKQTLITEAQ